MKGKVHLLSSLSVRELVSLLILLLSIISFIQIITIQNIIQLSHVFHYILINKLGFVCDLFDEIN